MTFIPDQGQRYQYWMGKRFSRGTWAPIQREMTVILEPDAIGLMGARRSCLKRSQVPGRLALLAYAAKRLGETPGMNVYIDAGVVVVAEAVHGHQLPAQGRRRLHPRVRARGDTLQPHQPRDPVRRQRRPRARRQALRHQHGRERQRVATEVALGQVRLQSHDLQPAQRRSRHPADDPDRVAVGGRVPVDFASGTVLQRQERQLQLRPQAGSAGQQDVARQVALRGPAGQLQKATWPPLPL